MQPSTYVDGDASIRNHNTIMPGQEWEVGLEESASSFCSGGEIRITEGDVEYLVGADETAFEGYEHIHDGSLKEVADMAALLVDLGEQTSQRTSPRIHGIVKNEHTSSPSPNLMPPPPRLSRVEHWLHALGNHHEANFQHPDLAGPFPPSPHTPPSLLANLPSFLKFPGLLSEPMRVDHERRTPRPNSQSSTPDKPPLQEYRPKEGLGLSSMNNKKFTLRQRQSRRLNNSRGANSQNPILDSFVPLSPSRARSLSPHKRIARQSVHINMDLTEYQIDRLTDAFSSHISSPSRDRASATDRHASSVAKPTMPETVYSTRNTRDTPGSRVHLSKGLESLEEIANGGAHCTDIRDDLCRKRQSMTDISVGKEYTPRHRSKELPGDKTLAQRRNQIAPDNIEIEDSRKYGTYRAGTVPAPSHPLRQSSLEVLSLDEEISSLYSQDAPHPTPQTGVAYLRGDTMSQKIENVMQTYDDWASPGQSAPIGGGPSRMSPGRHTLQPHDPSVCRRAADGTERAGTAKVAKAKITAYSPLMTYFAFEGVPFQKVGGKTMIGDQGWLERPVAGDANSTDQQKKDFSPKKLGLLDSIKKMAKDMTESKNSRRPREPEKVLKRLRIIISLNPREQSLLYCELEFHVNNALHAYITSELNHGRLDPNKLKKIADGWAQKGRPKVVGFHYDVETQLHLLDLHIEDFRFFGRRQGNPAEIAGLLHAMKVNARAMRVRTYCQPDSVIAKQLVDSQSLFNTVGCSEGQQIALAEIAQFFKVIVERERHYRDHLHRAGRRANAGAHEQEAHPGRRWEPQLGDDLIPEGTFDVYGSLTGTEEHHEQWQGRPE